MPNIVVVEAKGSHLLLRRHGRFAVLERRDGRTYGVRDGARRAFPDTSEGMLAACEAQGWGDESPMRELFQELTRRGEDLARRLW